MVYLLLGRGCDVNVQDLSNNTALHYACIYGHLQIIRTLLSSKNIDINLKNIENKTPMQAAPNDYEIHSSFECFMKNKKKEQCEKSKNIKENNDGFIANSIKENKKKEIICPNSFVVVSLLGKGSFAEVYLVEKKNDKKLFAMKVLHKNKIRSFFLIVAVIL